MLGAFAFALVVQSSAQSQPASARAEPGVWDDTARFEALASRREPWPLRDYPPPRGWPSEFVCEVGTGLPVRIGEARLSLPFFHYVVPSPANERLRAEWLSNRQLTRAERCDKPADWATAPVITEAYWEVASLAAGQLDRRCYRPGLPGDPRPECDRPNNTNWWLTFVRGLPVDITLFRQSAHVAPSEPLSGIYRWVTADPAHRRVDRPDGGYALLDGRGRLAGVVLARTDAAEETTDPLFVSCPLGYGSWQPPERGSHRAWTRCEVRYRHRGVLDVAYRFLREVFDEPDIPALDRRVRQVVQAMLDGAAR